jgi:Rrf2 family transcriptional regulator, iron-sulfur cluster assembly transcription factor
MRFSSKTGYGVQALFDMAFHGSGRAVQAREVAERQGIPLRYLEQILQELRRANLIDAKRGPGGGYVLARPPETVRLSEIIAALDGPIGTVSAAASSGDVPALMFRDLEAQMDALFAAVSLRDLVTRAEGMGLARAAVAPQMYFI